MTVKKLYGNYKKIQDIYNNEGLRSKSFYLQVIAYIKRLLNKYLYQRQFNEDNINDCFVAIYEKVAKNYDSEKGCLGTFIHTIVRNYCTKVNYRLVNHQKPISLDFEYINKEELLTDYLSDIENIEEDSNKDITFDEDRDNIENYCMNLTGYDSYDNLDLYCDLNNYYNNLNELKDGDKNLDKLYKLDAVRKDLLWNIWKEQLKQY